MIVSMAPHSSVRSTHGCKPGLAVSRSTLLHRPAPSSPSSSRRFPSIFPKRLKCNPGQSLWRESGRGGRLLRKASGAPPRMTARMLALLSAAFGLCAAFAPPAAVRLRCPPSSPDHTSCQFAPRRPAPRRQHRSAMTPSMAQDKPAVIIAKDEDSVGMTLCAVLQAQAIQTCEEKGHFYFAISGGSMLNMLSNLAVNPAIDSMVPWDACTMGFVSHRAVPLDDDGATFYKARPLFLQSWMDQGLKVITPTGSGDAAHEADAYEAALKAAGVPVNAAGLTQFDLLLIGMGNDGHVGSIYPNLPDVDSPRSVLAATSGTGKISLSLAAMEAATTSVVACAGKSEKAPQGKAQAAARALESSSETVQSFPASALRHKASWLLCQDSASLLQEEYG